MSGSGPDTKLSESEHESPHAEEDIPEPVAREASDRVARLERDLAALREELSALASELGAKAKARAAG